ncbi:hypothetical protein PoB_003880900 [Plakobranchus ocellatus]|uniref:Uncharacterized protein n=1 Tax=Plakobranchus ocellatus TaxID=259542 RepID=A0AAV4AWX8_9GAST|nr:hypothetical protein PoB_003880900 [Plakobranchus ocellatus]
MGGKEKTFHANLLKGYIARDQNAGQATTDERPPTSSSAIPAASVTVIEDFEGEHFNDSDCEALPELGGWGSKESVSDLVGVANMSQTSEVLSTFYFWCL